MTDLSMKEQVLNALKTVQDPEIKKDLVSLNMIQDLDVQDGVAKFKIILTTAACPLKSKIKSDAEQAVQKIDGIKKVEIEMGAKVPSDGRTRAMLKSEVKNVIAVASGKGGVGKSTVAVNLAVYLAKTGAKVGLLDADIYGPNVPTMMGPSAAPSMVEDMLDPPEAYGVRIMSIGYLVRPDQPLIWRGPLLHKTIQQFISDVNWGDLDYLIIDLPPGTGDAQLSIAQSLSISGGVIVTLPQKVSVDDARRGLQMFKEMKVPVLGIIENMSYLPLENGEKMDIFGSGGGEELAKEMKVSFLGKIPIDPEVRSGGDEGKPIVVSSPESESAKAMIDIACNIAGQVSLFALKGNS